MSQELVAGKILDPREVHQICDLAVDDQIIGEPICGVAETKVVPERPDPLK